jgi:hypothetical protein
MIFFFHSQAAEELEAAARYYEDCQPGLGFEFIEEVFAAIVRIQKFPAAWPFLSKNTRRCLVNRFPFGVVFQVKSDSIRIVAVTHLHRAPGYWGERIE